MTKEEVKDKMCSQKRTYPTQAQAFGGALRASRKTGKPMRAYPCPHCHKFHLTSRKA